MTALAGRWRLSAAGGFLGLFIYDGVVRPLLSGFIELPTIPGGLRALTVILLLFSVLHASFLLGGRLSLAFFVGAATISWLFEELGVATGLIYGPYHYTEALGPWLGSVPLLIPLAWFMMVYPSYALATLIIDGRPVALRGDVGHLASLALLGALLMTAWDLVIDPILSGPAYRAWIWEADGSYFGVPAQNYVGWLVTTFVVQLFFRLAERRWSPRPAGRVSAVVAAMPLTAYAAMLVGNLLSGLAPSGVEVPTAIAMGIPIVAAAARLRGAADAGRDADG